MADAPGGFFDALENNASAFPIALQDTTVLAPER
jgi:hypothetical protein